MKLSVVGVWVLLTASEKPDPTGQRMTSWEPDKSGINSTDYTEYTATKTARSINVWYLLKPWPMHMEYMYMYVKILQ